MVIDDCYVFFFKQKTAYEMRSSDWSSDVCSSDLYPERRRRECKKGPAMPIPSLWTRRRAGTGGRSDILEGQRHHRCRKVGIGLDHDDLAMAGLDRDGVGALIGQHQIDLVLANRTEVAEQHIFALRCVGIMDCLAGNFCNNTIGGHEIGRTA